MVAMCFCFCWSYKMVFPKCYAFVENLAVRELKVTVNYTAVTMALHNQSKSVGQALSNEKVYLDQSLTLKIT